MSSGRRPGYSVLTLGSTLTLPKTSCRYSKFDLEPPGNGPVIFLNTLFSTCLVMGSLGKTSAELELHSAHSSLSLSSVFQSQDLHLPGRETVSGHFICLLRSWSQGWPLEWSSQDSERAITEALGEIKVAAQPLLQGAQDREKEETAASPSPTFHLPLKGPPLHLPFPSHLHLLSSSTTSLPPPPPPRPALPILLLWATSFSSPQMNCASIRPSLLDPGKTFSGL